MFTVPFRATISRNHISLTNEKTGESVTRTASRPFSSADRLIADAANAASFLGGLVRDLEGRRRWFLLATADVALIGEQLTQQDQREAERLFTEQGFVRVRVK